VRALSHDQGIRQIGQILDKIVRVGVENRQGIEARTAFHDPGLRAIGAIDLVPGIEEDRMLLQLISPVRGRDPEIFAFRIDRQNGARVV
jgi:hypothetical protein